MVGLGESSLRALIAVLTVIGLILVPATASAAAPGGDETAVHQGPPPNVVTIVTDDQTLEQYKESVMPQTMAKLGAKGTTFSQAITSTPQCCPSRAGYLTGQYAHNNGVIANRPGYPLLRRKKDVLPAWLHAAGYRTLHVGKYLNGYSEEDGLHKGPGWDRWLTMVEADYTKPGYSFDGKYRQPDEFLTTLNNEKSVDLIERYAPAPRPFYLQVDQFAPHVGSGAEGGRCDGGAVPAPQDVDLFTDATAPADAATTEDDVSDKPEFIRRVAPLTDMSKIDLRYGCALASLASVDRGVSQIVGALRRSGELGNTMIIFTSDNGYSYAEHRMPLSKGLPYEEHVRVPLVIRPPASFPERFREGATLDAPVANIDLAPTILGLTHSKPCRANGVCRRMDGRTLLPLLRGATPGWEAKRAVLTSFSVNFKAYRRSCVWDGFRTPSLSLIEHLELPEPGGALCRPAAEYEVYDLLTDPFQLENDAPPTEQEMERLRSLQACTGIRGRDPKRKSRPFCE